MTKNATRGAWLLLGIAGALAACSSDDDTAASAGTPAKPQPDPVITETQKAEDRFWSAIGRGDWAATESLVTSFEEARKKEPENARAIALHGLVALWRMAESERAGDPQKIQAIGQSSAPTVIEALKTAHEKDPKNTVLTAFYATVSIDLGTMTKNDGIVMQGRGLFAQAKAEDPIVGNAFQILTLRTLAPSSPDFDAALEAGWQWLDLCGTKPMNRDAPDFEGWVKELSGFTGSRKFCGDTDKAPYALPTMLLTFGDALVAKGKIEAGRKAYLATHVVRDKPFIAAPAWPHADVVEKRLAEDLSARAKSYSDPDPRKWAEMGTNPASCTVCHSTSGK